ncbi:asparagine synthase (glutamine-hydrolyzing) [Sphingomonas cavernae]|uniref:asparagine synthase (glutamine-hydrolyzing) n=1 Tax=Sphingomonas cavernae TaxID=2320861 RepID=A0A418WQY3_9SPHN|nr:asparagine synthase (glutamine-hydrolyzing) [Sphingomonas cavernae]RJF93637.1 asparagine synthase (glutamine-hydrolyzing) [Sphingomonas cavernae]
MCGIAGFFDPSSSSGISAMLAAMTDVIAHRGPDDTGAWIDPAAQLALGHRRLSIIDLSPAGHQPMISATKRYVIVYNGEIYNHSALRAELEAMGAAPRWKGHSDTEVMLAAFERWGVEGALSRFNGMFAFALWDRELRALYLARDRMGEKPLYYGQGKGAFLFASELKAIAAHPAFEPVVDQAALALFMRHSYVPAPHSIWRGIRKLPAAHYIVVRDNGASVSDPICYWNFTDIAMSGVASPRDDHPGLVDELEALLCNAVAQRMEADVPLGAFLSGGIDSSTIVALMQSVSSRPVRTFSIGFDDGRFDEAPYARAVAEHLGTDHCEMYVTAGDALAVIPQLPTIWDEPFADPSQIPTYLVSKLTRNHVTVSLSGDGGDELFAGYARYHRATRVRQSLGHIPLSLRSMVGRSLQDGLLQGMVGAAERVLPQHLRRLAPADRLSKLGSLFRADSNGAFYRDFMSIGKPTGLLATDAHVESQVDAPPLFTDLRQQMMYLDTLIYLPDDILAKVDRASMAVSLEARVPFLDHRVVEFAWRLPMSAKVKDGRGKHILRQVLHRHIPEALVDRPKKGFGLPLADWLSGPLSEWAEALLEPHRLREEGFFDADQVSRIWSEHRSGKRRWHFCLWDILMFQAWHAEQRLSPPLRSTPPHALRLTVAGAAR